MKTGSSCVVGLLVSMHPPWSIDISTNTLPGFITFNICLVMTFGASLPTTYTEPMTKSDLLIASEILSTSERI